MAVYIDANSEVLDSQVYTNDENIIFVDLSHVPFYDRSMQGTFQNCSNLTSVTNINPLVTSMSGTFFNCINIVTAPVIPSSVTDMSQTFLNCTNLVNAPIIPNNVTNIANTFSHCTNLVNAPVIPNNVTDMKGTFARCTNLINAPVIPNPVTNMRGTFSLCSNLATTPTIPNNVIDMGQTFIGCTKITTIPNIPNSVVDMYQTFYGCNRVTISPDIPNSVTNMSGTFSNCTNLTTISNISNSVINMANTFYECDSLTGNIYIKSSEVEDATSCFENTSLIKNVYIPFRYSSNIVQTKTYNAFTNAGYDTLGTLDNVYLMDSNPIYFTLTVNPTPADATVTLTAPGYTQQGNTIRVIYGTVVDYVVSKSGCPTKTGSVTVTSDQTLNVNLAYVPSVNEVIVNLTGSSAYESNTVFAPGIYRIEVAPGLDSASISREGTSVTFSYKICVMSYTETINTYFTIRGYCGSDAVSESEGGYNPYSGPFKVNTVDARTLSNSNQPVGIDVNHIFGAGGGNAFHRGSGISGAIAGTYYSGGIGNCLGNGNVVDYNQDVSPLRIHASGAGSCLHIMPINGVFGTDYLRAYHVTPMYMYSAGGGAYGGGAAPTPGVSPGWFTRGGNSPYGTGATTEGSNGGGIGGGQYGSGSGAYYNGQEWVDVPPNTLTVSSGVLPSRSFIKITYLGPIS